jgi:Flp pilus assembly protein TadG
VADRRRANDGGTAVVEFVLVGVLLTALFLALVQLGLALHVRNTLQASVAEGARYAANADRSQAEGIAVTRQLIRASLADRYASDVSSGTELVAGVPTVYVQVDAPLPVIGFVGPWRTLHVRGHAVEEGAG